MAEDNNQEFAFDQPWNPISYFEEENEAVGKCYIYYECC